MPLSALFRPPSPSSFAMASAVKSLLGNGVQEIRFAFSQTAPASASLRSDDQRAATTTSSTDTRGGTTPTQAVSDVLLLRASFLPCRRSVLSSCPLSRQFVAAVYPQLKSASPNFPVLVRESSEAQPKITARYGQTTQTDAQTGTSTTTCGRLPRA